MDQEREESICLYHTACPKCGSKDNRGVYSDGHSFCFGGCGYFPPDGETAEVAKKKMTGLISGSCDPLAKRRITQETARKFGYACGTYEGRGVQIANYYADGELSAQHLRFEDKGFKWLGDVTNLGLFGQQLWRDRGKRIVITEGEIDCMSISQVFNNKWQTVSVPNGAASAKKYIANQIEWLEKYDDVVFAFDADDPGRKAAKECASLFTPGKARIAVYPTGFKDASDMLQKGMETQISTLVFEAKVFRPDGIIQGSELKQKVRDYWTGGGQYLSFETPYPEMNKLLAGIRKKEITMFTAGTGIGKSTIVREISNHFLEAHKLTVGYVALEENTLRTALGMMSIHLNKPLHLSTGGVTEEAYEKAFAATVGCGRFYLYDHFGSLESDNLIAKLRYLATGCGCDFIVVDHISIAVSGIEDGDERRIIDNLMTKLRSLVEQTGVGVLCVCHLKNPVGGGPTFEEGKRPSLNDLRGSGGIKQMSDNVVAMARDQLAEDGTRDISTVYVLKCRFTGDTGAADTLEYSKNTGRLLVQGSAIPDGFTAEDFSAPVEIPKLDFE